MASVLAVAAVFAFGAGRSAAASPAERAKAILTATGVRGGLVVHVGCGGGELTAALWANHSYLVHGLDADAKNVSAAREHIRSLGAYGPVSVARFDGRRLPYIDNTVNLVVADELGGVALEEVMRVLCPEGVAYIRTGGEWVKTVKPRPKEIDEWTHYMHDAGGNAVAHDSVIGPPRRLQWQGSPRWARHHDHMSSVSGCVTTGGRVFYIFDEATRASILTPPNWKLIARDAFNGTILWKRPILKWFTHMLRLKSGPAILPRRLVAVGDRVYVTLGIDASLTALDAATGETVRTYADTKGTQEVLVSDGVVFLVADKPGPAADAADAGAGKRRGGSAAIWELTPRRLLAVRADTGEDLWRKGATVLPMTLAATAKGLYFHDGEKIVCLDRTSGKVKWESKPVARTKSLQSFYGATLLVYDGVVLFAGGERAGQQTGRWYTGGTDSITALSAASGEVLWRANHPPSGYRSPEDVLVLDGVVWLPETTSGRAVGEIVGRDVKTGREVGKFDPDVDTYWFHHRCYRGKATDKYLLMSRTGIEFIDPKTEHWQINHWIRGACLYGIMPANGLIYTPPHPCACYPEAKQNGFSAVAPSSAEATEGRPAAGASAGKPARLTKGPAYGAIDDRKVALGGSGSGDAAWATYRADAARSGRTKTPVPAKLAKAWTAKLGGRLSSVVVAEGKLFVASVDDHTVHALDAKTGKPVWRYTAGGRVDSPPTIYRGRAIFGGADGYVYCLRAADGELVWRFRAAPDDRRLVAFEQVESVWPVHGSVLVLNGVVHCVAGRSMFLDGGLRLLQLDAKTGRKLAEKVLDDRDPASEKGLQTYIKNLDMPVALPDILSSDGKYVYMRSQRFDLTGNRQDIAPRGRTEQIGEGEHLFCPSGFLDGDYWHRTYWVYGRTFSGGYGGYSQAGKHAPAGKILVFDDDTVYGFGRKAKYYRWTTPIEHHLFADVKGALRTGGPARRGGQVTSGAWVSVANSVSLDPTGKALAVEAWVKADKPNGVVIARGGPSQGYALILTGGKCRFVVRSGQTVATVAAKETVVGKWVHLAGVLSGEGKLKLFVDGKLSATAGGGKLISAVPVQATEIGADAGGAVGNYPTPYAFTGCIDEVRVFHGEVTDAEVGAHAAAAGKVQAEKAKLVLCLSFDTDAGDTSGRANHGKVGRGVKPVKGRFSRALKFAPPKAAVSRKGIPQRGGGSSFNHRWMMDLPLMARGMVLADKTLFVAGIPDVVDEDQAARDVADPQTQAALAEQRAAWGGTKGALLWAVSAADGAKLAAYELDSSPVWDGLIAAGGRLYWATEDGKIVCMGAAK